jgi:hypothetical protein
MSAAATAAGYLYASGRLRGREKREPAEGEKPQSIEKPKAPPEVRVAAVPAREDARPRRTPIVQYRTRRWKPNAAE